MTDTLLALKGIQKSFSGVPALRRVDLELRAGEVHALVGENGAGKSTLMKILAGAISPDAGEIWLDGKVETISSPHRAKSLGIAMIHQEFFLVPEMTVAENILLGREPGKGGFVSKAEANRIARKAMTEIGIDIDPSARVSSLNVAGMQLVEITKAVSQDARIVVMDEPSAALTEHELEGLYDIVRKLRERGRSVLYISHRMEEIFGLCDRATVLRDGTYVQTLDITQTDANELIRLMVGREITEQFPPRGAHAVGEEVLRLDAVSTGRIKDVSLQIRKGEIVGVAGLVGSGRSAIARAVFGIDRITLGQISLYGKPLGKMSPRRMVRAGVGFLTEDRKRTGLVMPQPIRANASLAALNTVSAGPFIRGGEERRRAAEYREQLRIRSSSIEQGVGTLSGGNQQKTLLARWLWHDAGLLIVDEPTRGIDVGAKAEIYRLLRTLSERGVAILMISSEMPEVLGLSDRILVMRHGRVAAKFEGSEATQEAILAAALGD